MKPWSQDWLIAAGAYPSFCSMKRLEVCVLPLDGMLVHRRSLLLWGPCGICQIWKYVNWMRISLIKRVSRGPPCCFGVVRLVLSIHDNFGDEDGMLQNFYSRKGERHPKQAQDAK